MRILARLRARADAAYDNAYHDKLRGRIWRALDGTKWSEVHDENRPKPFSYSNPFPPKPMEEGDSRTLLIASPYENLLAHIAMDFQTEPELNIGEMPFTIDDVQVIEPDVGEPGTSGTIVTGTGVIVRIPPRRFDDYGIDNDYDQPEFWEPKHTLEPFQTQLVNNLDRKHGLFCEDHLPGPSDVDGNLFDNYELMKTFALPVRPTTGVEETWFPSKWEFEYTVRDDHHRRHLNLALDVGIGERNSLGFGFINKRVDES